MWRSNVFGALRKMRLPLRLKGKVWTMTSHNKAETESKGSEITPQKHLPS
jgi:hypothetical protein